MVLQYMNIFCGS